MYAIASRTAARVVMHVPIRWNRETSSAFPRSGGWELCLVWKHAKLTIFISIGVRCYPFLPISRQLTVRTKSGRGRAHARPMGAD